MKAYKSLEAHNYFTSGRVSGVTAKRVPSKRVIVLSEVNTRGSQSKVPVKQQKIRNGLERDPESSCEV
ncbi:hypothetical protein HPB52_004274 [Rhipicephalus sanguineus]|uniref:Uncharacterized protein n=1 Tax=Rhipicephalus sanguineus TaxID=34632 RepID=A0A9D4STW9_RHISA|nr:hypothetical protein HPB52_004274 [Rhipicephalus sanguineus]